MKRYDFTSDDICHSGCRIEEINDGKYVMWKDVKLMLADKDFGNFLVGVANNTYDNTIDGLVAMPKQFTEILKGTAQKAGILGRLKREKLTVPFPCSETLLEDEEVVGSFAWQYLNKAISSKKPERLERFSNNAKEIHTEVNFVSDEMAFRFVIRAI